MLDIYICSEQSNSFSVLKEMCFRYLMIENLEAEIYFFNEECISSSAAVYMIPLNCNTEQLSRRLRGINRENYIVVLLDKATDSKKAVTPGISPSGLLIRPWNKADVKMLLDELYSDYRKCGEERSDKSIFRFKQKVKEYSFPYERILYFESRNKKIVVRTDTQEFEFYDTLDSIRTSAPEYFMKIHKSFIVNLSRIVSVDYGALKVEFDDGSAAFLSRTFKNELKERISERGRAKCSQRT